MKPRRPALRYFGGKWLLSEWVIGHLPPHVCYVEPFMGGGSVLLRKPRVPHEVMNDLDGDVVNFFRVLRDRPDDIARAVALTPFSRAELHLAYETAPDELERARRLFVRSWQGRGGPRTQWRSGWRYTKSIQSDDGYRVADVENLLAVAERLSGVQLECEDAMSIVRRFDTPETMFYCDPPYLVSVRGGRWASKAYQHETTDADHVRFAECLRAVKGMVVVSGYDSPLYEDLFAGWGTVRRAARKDVGEAIETLWLSPAVMARRAGDLFTSAAGQ